MVLAKHLPKTLDLSWAIALCICVFNGTQVLAQPLSEIEENYKPGKNIPSLIKRSDLLPGKREAFLSDLEKKTSKSLPISSVSKKELIPINKGKLPPIRLEARYDKPLSLKDALEIAYQNNLPIKISTADYQSSKNLFYSSLGKFLPDNTLIYRVQDLSADGSTSRTSTLSETVRMPVFRGGQVLYGAISSYDDMKSSKFALKEKINNTLLDVFDKYNDLLLQKILLQVRLKAVEVSRSQLALNQQLYDHGNNTLFAIAQSTTQLALDKQSLLSQQIAVRKAALQLALAMNLDMSINLDTNEKFVSEKPLIDSSIRIERLLAVAMKNRPELKKLDYNRLARRADIAVSRAPLYPTAQFFISYNRIGGDTGGGGGANPSLISNQNDSAGGVGGSGVAGVGAQPAGVVIPSGAGGTGLGVGGGNSSVTAGFDISWNLSGMGVTDSFNTRAAKIQARKALLQYNEEVIKIQENVRRAYLETLAAEEQIDVSGEAVISSSEELRLATIRLNNGLGTNLELIQAQNSYVDSLTNQAQSIIDYNKSQANLLRELGIISISNLVRDNRPFKSLDYYTRRN